MISCAHPLSQYEAYREEIRAAIDRVLDSGQYILGQEVEAFEHELAGYLGAARAVGVNSGTDALFLSMKALGIGAGDEVIVPSHTATPTVAAVSMAGATPVMVDVEDRYYTIDPARVRAAIGTRTRAVIAVHLYGQAAAIEDLQSVCAEHGVHLIEDCAQAFGAERQGRKLGTIGDVGCFSFFPTKNLGAIGDGGAVVTGHGDIADRLRSIRQYGWDAQRIAREPGWNSRLDEIQASILRVKLRHIDRDNARRAALARRYDERLAKLPLGLPPTRDGNRHVYHLYVVQVQQRAELYRYLQDQGIQAGIHYPVACHRMPAFSESGRYGDMASTDALTDRIISLPLYPELDLASQDQVINAIEGFFA